MDSFKKYFHTYLGLQICIKIYQIICTMSYPRTWNKFSGVELKNKNDMCTLGIHKNIIDNSLTS